MTKKETIQWLKNYLKQQDAVYECEKGVRYWKDRIAERDKPLKKEEKAGVFGSILGGIGIAIVGTIPCTLIFAVIWLIWSFIELFKVQPRLHPDAILYSDLVIEKATGIVIEDVQDYFNH
ncbi:MAG: hypothetical protein Q4P20_11445, partial [Eubacteriales bacterium]|nr:hypothetical protein [Eubacteriales bacterium]